MTWPIALLLAVSCLFAVAYLGSITAMIGLAVCDAIGRQIERALQ